VVVVTRGEEELVAWPLESTPDIWMVDMLARIQLVAREHGAQMRLHHVSTDLAGLLELAGLSGELGVEMRREPERRK
jgi:hypothetical protein